MKLISLENLERFKANFENKFGKADGLAQLDENGQIPKSQIPDDAFNVEQYDDFEHLPEEGRENKIYIDVLTNYLYRWDTETSQYINTSSPEGVKYTPQTLTDEQKAQARQNIGAMEAGDLPTDVVKYTSQSLSDEQKAQARLNIGAADSSVSTAISEIQAELQELSENVSDVTKTDNGIRITYANGVTKDIEIDSDFPIKSVVYDDEHYLHFYDENGNDLFDNVYIAGGGGGGQVGSVKITRITNESVDSIFGKPINIRFSVEALDSSGDPAILRGSTWSIDGITVARNIPVSQGENSFNIGPYLNVGSNVVKIAVTADTGGEADVTATKTWRVNAVNMRFEWNYNDTQINTSAFNDTWTVYGDIEKTSHTKIGNTELPTTTTTKTGATQSIQIPMQEHGAYGVERWLTATIGGVPQSTDIQYHEMIFVEAGNETPIIAIPRKNISMKQYDTVRIPVVVYDPTSILTDATLYVDNVEIGEWSNIDRSIQYWSYTPTVSGEHTLAVKCKDTIKELPISVEEVQLDIAEVEGYTFRFKSSEFASNNAVRNWNSNGITATFSNNFDWTNGGLHTETDENGNLQQYLCIKAGSTMTINHKLFSTDPKSQGMTFKIIYKVKNCRNYDARIAHCYSSVGIQMFAHNAVFNSTGQTITIPYGEDEYAELEFDVYPVSGYRYMMAWMDGVITSCRVYDTNDNFVQALDAQENIILGSDDCDVYIYMVKAYPFLVSRDGHIDNFIMDAPNASEMAQRYNRNNILDEGGEINYTKLIEQNPDCRVWLYDMAYMPNSKDDKVGKDDPSKRAKFYQFWNNGSQYYQIEGTGIMSIQGTSSVEYKLGAANTDINFTALKDGNNIDLMANGTKDETYGNNWFVEDPENLKHAKVFDVGEGEVLGPECVPVEKNAQGQVTKYIKALGLKLNDNSCPITYSNTKVNFASCEQVNNMCNAAWYQMYNPYPSITARDCMEFNMGVQFVKDSGEIPDDQHFVLFGDSKYHMYSIANMGNSKKNIHVFHDLTNIDDVCIEVNDNDKDQMRMVNPNHLSRNDYFAAETWNGKVYYGMRYPDTKNPRQEVKDAWYDLVWWMATSNPNDATGEQLTTPETYGDYTFRGHDRDGLQVLRGTTVTQYSGTYTHDTFERRMAKMLSECEDHMVMDSFMYHYIYLERHTMVDNVSKNNFWSSTDLIHWDLSKAYDMDTSDGNNNQGQLVFDYGNEWNDDIGGMKVYNGSDSVWFVFCANLYEACKTMFTNREAAGAWSATAYHNFLLSEQRKVPERCWVQCYWYDYLRTYEQGISEEWMTFLDGGQKTHQRRHFEYFEELYDSSKYRGSASTSQNVNFRAYTPNTYGGNITREGGAPLKSTANNAATTLVTVPKDEVITIIYPPYNSDWYRASYGDKTGYMHKSSVQTVDPKGEVTITMYNKMYISVDAGTTALAPVKAERGVPVTINFSNGGTLNNTLILINTASMIQAISGMEQLFPDTCVFSMAIRLRELTIGSNIKGYENTFLRTLALGNNTMLERLYVQNLPNATSPLDLSNCPALLYIDADGSGFTAYTFAKGGLLEEATLNKPTSLSMVNLSNLEQINFTINDCTSLIALRCENMSDINTFQIVNDAVNLQIVRLLGIDWNMPNANTLNRMLTLQGMDENNITIPQSVLAGTAYAPSMRQRNLDQYALAWSDLTVTYDNIVEEFLITFHNPDGSAVKDKSGNAYTQYVDRGQTIEDPVVSGEINTPTMEATAQYTYTFTGWENITGTVMDTRDVIATYESEVRMYRVRWYAQTGTLLKSIEVPYGSEAIYQDETHTFPPVKTDEEENFFFWVFKNWNKSTGFVTSDIDVYAVWDRAPLPTYDPSNPLNLKNMSIAQIYGIAKTYRASTYFNDEDYTDIVVGKDFNFENVTSRVLLEERYFNGEEILKCDGTSLPLIKLFDADSPSFTLAIDYEFCEATSNATLISCCDQTGSAEGFRVHYYLGGTTNENNSIKVLWGDRTDIVAHGLNRGMLVLKHTKGSKNLLIASDNGGRYVSHADTSNYGGDNLPDGQWEVTRYDAYNDEIHYSELPRTQETTTDSVLSFGAMAYGTSGYRFPAKGWIHWCKIWFDDLGVNNIKELACWPHETWRMQYRGNGLYNKDDGTGLMDGASFVASAPLSQYYEMFKVRQSSDICDTTGSWRESLARNFVNTRCLKALPYEWQSIIRPVSIVTKGGKDNPTNLEYTTDKIYIPAYADLVSVPTGLDSSEGRQISWFTDSSSRVKFMGMNTSENTQIIVSPEDPTLYTSTYNVKENDIWVIQDTNGNNLKCYIYVSANTASKHNTICGRPVSDTTNNLTALGAQGGKWIRSNPYWSRTNNGDNYQYTVFNTGRASIAWISYLNYQRRGLVLMFSI